jgi:hypothetical protein
VIYINTKPLINPSSDSRVRPTRRARRGRLGIHQKFRIKYGALISFGVFYAKDICKKKGDLPPVWHDNFRLALPQPHARLAAVLGDKLDAGGFADSDDLYEVADHVGGALLALRALGALSRSCGMIRIRS